MIKYLPTYILLNVISITFGYSQIKILDFLNPDSCDYKFYFQYVRDDENVNLDSFPNFIIEDKERINELINNWTGKYADGMYMCWYDYFVYIVCNDEIIDLLQINYECKQVVTNKFIIDFDTTPFFNLPNNKRFSTYNFGSRDIDEARNFVERAKERSGIFLPDFKRYHWLNYDGRFFMQVHIDSTMRDLRPKDYERIIRDKYPRDSIIVDFWGFGGNTMEAYVYCDEDFYKRFNLYRKKEWKKLDSYFSVFIFGDPKIIEELKTRATHGRFHAGLSDFLAFVARKKSRW